MKSREDKENRLNDVNALAFFEKDMNSGINNLIFKCTERLEKDDNRSYYRSYQNYATDIQLNPWGGEGEKKKKNEEGTRLTCDLTVEDERAEVVRRATLYTRDNGMEIDDIERETLIKLMDARRLVYTKKNEIFGTALGAFKFLDWLNAKRTEKRLEAALKSWRLYASEGTQLLLDAFERANSNLKECQYKNYDTLEKFGTCVQTLPQSKRTGWERAECVEKLLKEAYEKGELKHSLAFVGTRTLDDEILEKTEKWIPKEMLDSSFFLNTADETYFSSSALTYVQLNVAQFDAGDFRLDGEKTGGLESGYYRELAKLFNEKKQQPKAKTTTATKTTPLAKKEMGLPKGWERAIREEEEEEEKEDGYVTDDGDDYYHNEWDWKNEEKEGEGQLLQEDVQKKFCVEMFGVNRFGLALTFEKKRNPFHLNDGWADAPLAVSHAQFNWKLNRDHLFLGKTFQVQIMSRPFKMLPAEDVYVDCLRVKKVKEDYCEGIIKQEHVSLLMEIKNIFHGVTTDRASESGPEEKEWSQIVKEKRECERMLMEELREYEKIAEKYTDKEKRNELEKARVVHALRFSTETKEESLERITALYKRYFKVKRYKLVSLLIHNGSGTAVGGSGHFTAEGIVSCAYGSSDVSKDYCKHFKSKDDRKDNDDYNEGPFPTRRDWKAVYYDNMGLLGENRSEEARNAWCGTVHGDRRLPYGSDPSCLSFGLKSNVPCLDDSFAKLVVDVNTNAVFSSTDQKFKEDHYRVFNVDFRSETCCNQCKDPEGDVKKAIERWRKEIEAEVQREEESYETEIKPIPSIWKEHYGIDWIRPTMRYIYIKDYENVRISSLRYALVGKVRPTSSSSLYS